MAQAGTRGFVPSADGFAFANSWPSGPAVSVPLLAGSVGIGNAARGLCGGMVFAALDYWHAGAVPPAVQPAAGTPLFRFIVRRLIDSWHLPAGVARYYWWMLLPDSDTSICAGRRRPGRWRGITRRTLSREWPIIRARLDAGAPAALAVVTVASASPLLLGGNHQVLAYDYSIEGTAVTVRVYDPNVGPDDTVWIRFDTASPAAAGRAGAFSHNLGLRLPVRGFFLTRYAPARPPSPVSARQPRGRRAAGTPSG